MSSTVSDYKPSLVQDKIVDVFRMRRGEATTADLVAVTGLPKAQVEAELPAVADEFGARLRVTESGEILYSFPSGMKSRYRGFVPGFKRFWKAFKKGAAKVASLVFKIWIVVMLVGYFILFVALVLLALLASVALSVSGGGKDDRSDRGGGLGGLYLTTRLIDAFVNIWFYSELFKSPEERYYEGERRRERKRNKKPLHKAIFSFVFGDGDPNADWDTVEKKAVVAWIQANKGIITIHEFMSITGLGPLEAETAINKYLVEFEGEPEVSEAGTIYYSFPSLLRRKDKSDRTFGGTVPMKRTAAFSMNPKKANAWFCGLNGFNLLFGGYFLGESMALAGATQMRSGFDYLYAITYNLFGAFSDGSPALGIAIGLGAVPLVFSALFYAIPAIRSARLKKANEAVKLENLRRIAYRAIVDKPIGVQPQALAMAAAASPAASPSDQGAAEKVVLELAAATHAEPTASGAYSFPEIDRGEAEARFARARVRDEDFDLGGTVFDSHSDNNG
jgi:hypothetical protein